MSCSLCKMIAGDRISRIRSDLIYRLDNILFDFLIRLGYRFPIVLGYCFSFRFRYIGNPRGIVCPVPFIKFSI